MEIVKDQLMQQLEDLERSYLAGYKLVADDSITKAYYLDESATSLEYMMRHLSSTEDQIVRINTHFNQTMELMTAVKATLKDRMKDSRNSGSSKYSGYQGIDLTIAWLESQIFHFQNLLNYKYLDAIRGMKRHTLILPTDRQQLKTLILSYDCLANSAQRNITVVNNTFIGLLAAAHALS